MVLTKTQAKELEKIKNKYDMLIGNLLTDMQDAKWKDFMKALDKLKKQYTKEVNVVCKLVK